MTQTERKQLMYKAWGGKTPNSVLTAFLSQQKLAHSPVLVITQTGKAIHSLKERTCKKRYSKQVP